MKRRYFLIAVLIGIAITLGFVQEFVKININYILEKGGKIPTFFDQDPATKKAWMDSVREDAPYDYYKNHGTMEVLYNFSSRELSILKWVVTLFFIGVFLGINTSVIYLATRDVRFVRWTIILYGLFFVLSFAIYLFGHLTGTLEQSYGISREIVGGLQSMVPLMLLLPASWLLKHDLFNTSK